MQDASVLSHITIDREHPNRIRVRISIHQIVKLKRAAPNKNIPTN